MDRENMSNYYSVVKQNWLLDVIKTIAEIMFPNMSSYGSRFIALIAPPQHMSKARQISAPHIGR